MKTKEREEAIKSWGERHDINLHGIDLRVAFEDAETLFGAASVDRAGIVRSFVEELSKEFDRNMIDANKADTYSSHTRKSGFNSGLREASRIAARLVSQYKGEGK